MGRPLTKVVIVLKATQVRHRPTALAPSQPDVRDEHIKLNFVRVRCECSGGSCFEFQNDGITGRGLRDAHRERRRKQCRRFVDRAQSETGRPFALTSTFSERGTPVNHASVVAHCVVKHGDAAMLPALGELVQIESDAVQERPRQCSRRKLLENASGRLQLLTIARKGQRRAASLILNENPNDVVGERGRVIFGGGVVCRRRSESVDIR